MFRWVYASALTATLSGICMADEDVKLTYVPNSTHKLEQLIGDFDYADAVYYSSPLQIVPTASQTATRSGIAGTDTGYSFEWDGHLVFLFGDTVSPNVAETSYHGHDTFALSDAWNPDLPVVLNFFNSSPGVPLFITPPGISMAQDEIPNSGISVDSKMYMVCNTGAKANSRDPNKHDGDKSYLVKFDPTTDAFSTLRMISALDRTKPPQDPSQGHFIFLSPHEYRDWILMFGFGLDRGSDIYLSAVPKDSFESGVGTRYLHGVKDHKPIWSNKESESVPIVYDDPVNGPSQNPWPNDNPTVSNLSVVYEKELGLWLMTFAGGHQKGPNTFDTEGIYFAYSRNPWGPWSNPQLIYNAERDKGYGVILNNFGVPGGSTVEGIPQGPLTEGTLSAGTSAYQNGVAYAPQMIERFSRVIWKDCRPELQIDFTMSTLNPYTVIRMRSEFEVHVDR